VSVGEGQFTASAGCAFRPPSGSAFRGDCIPVFHADNGEGLNGYTAGLPEIPGPVSTESHPVELDIAKILKLLYIVCIERGKD
jgi:hypothetical protein